jgi:hypothetical protein
MSVTQVLGTDKAIRLNNYNTLGLVQNFNWAPNFNAQDVFELGRTTRLDTLMELETSGSFELASSGNLAGLLARIKTKYNAGTGAFEGFEYTPGVSGAGVNSYSFDQDDLARLKFDVVMHEKTQQTEFNRSTYLASCYPTSISGRIDANGTGSDSVNFSGLFVVGFPAPYHDIRAVPAVRATDTTLTLINGAAYNTGWTLAYVTIDGVPYTTNAANPYYATYATGTITMNGGFVVPAGVVSSAVFHKTATPNTDWSLVHVPDTVGTGESTVYGVRGFQANVYIAPLNAGAPASSEQWLRVQSLDYNIDFRMETMRQVAFNDQGTSIYHRAPTYPLAMTVNATVMETDWADWKAVLKKTFSGGGLYNNLYDFAPASMKKEFAVVVEYYTKDGTPIQTVNFGDLRVDGFGSRVAVGGRGEITWTFRGTAFEVTGYDI